MKKHSIANSDYKKKHTLIQISFGILILTPLICLLMIAYTTSSNNLVENEPKWVKNIINVFSSTSSNYLAGDEPEWVENTINTNTNITNVSSGPSYWSNVDHYLAFDIQFYNADTKQQITDYQILEELLQMFQATNEPFIYDRSRSTNGNLFLYYNGIVPANYKPSLFSGFHGKDFFPECRNEKISSIYMLIYHTYSLEVDKKLTIQNQLDEIHKSSYKSFN